MLELSRTGHVRLRQTQVYLSAALVRQLVGVRELHDGALLVSFLDGDLGTWRPKDGFRAFEMAGHKTLVTPPTS